MNYLDWNSAYDTGIASIDFDHRRLVGMLNAIHDLIVRGADPRAISDGLADFHVLAASHFALEEKIMHDEKYADLEERRETHYRLLDRVREIMDGYEEGSRQSAECLPEVLKEWLLEAMDVDVEMFAAINDASLRRWGLSRT
ncbi:MAG TPA: hemerythrin domain-containing protein [Hyphomicrobium sp.]|mgnify:CR=1 FL=1|nr:hemerythrin domain-containing protein [Hyphomicrobium sp.]